MVRRGERNRIACHADHCGREKYNLGLSIRRTIAVRQALVDSRGEFRRFIMFGSGETKPVDPGLDRTAYAVNRCVELHFSGDAGIEAKPSDLQMDMSVGR